MNIALIAASDDKTASLLARILEGEGFRTQRSATLEEAEQSIAAPGAFALAVVDGNFSRGKGMEFCRRLKSDPATKHLPAFLVTDLADFRSQVTGNRVVADLFLCRPIFPESLPGNLKSFLENRSSRPRRPHAFQWGPFFLNPADRKAAFLGKPLPRLSAGMFRLLYALAVHGDEIVSRSWLIYKLWKRPVKDRQVDVAIARLRKRLGPDAAQLLKPDAGKGYILASRSDS